MDPHYEEDLSSDPKADAGQYSSPFFRDTDWVEMPGCFWTPELEYTTMPPRAPTPGEVADTYCKRGGLEQDTSPVDLILSEIDFTTEYIRPEEQARMVQKFILYSQRQSNEDNIYFFDELDDDW